MKLLERKGIENHMDRLREGRIESIETSALHMDFLRDLLRIHSHIVAISSPALVRDEATNKNWDVGFPCLTSTVSDQVGYRV